MNTLSIAAAVTLAFAGTGAAWAGEVRPHGALAAEAPADQALDAKATAQCLALYGPGYMAVGGGTCIKVGGRVGLTVGTGGGWKQNRLVAPSGGVGAAAPVFGGVVPIVRAPSSYAAGPVGHIVHRSGSGFGTEADATVYVDAKTQTELGVLNTHLSVTGVRSTNGLRGPDYAR